MNERGQKSVTNPYTLRLAADIGGTFTDIAAFDEASGRLLLGKALSTPGKTEVLGYEAVYLGDRVRYAVELGASNTAVGFVIGGAVVQLPAPEFAAGSNTSALAN